MKLNQGLVYSVLFLSVSFLSISGAVKVPSFKERDAELEANYALIFARNFLGEKSTFGADATLLIQNNFDSLCDFECPFFGKINDRYQSEPLGARKLQLLRYVFTNLSVFLTDQYYLGILKGGLHLYLNQCITMVEVSNPGQIDCSAQITTFFDFICGQSWLNKQIDWNILCACLMHVYFDLLWQSRDCVSAKIETPEERQAFSELIESADIGRETKNLWNSIVGSCSIS